MGHFQEKFSSVLAGPLCPVAVDDIKKKIRYPDTLLRVFDKYVGSYFDVYMWRDYPKSHHVN